MLAGYLGTTLGALPALCLASLYATRGQIAGVWWWMAGGFGASFVADVVAGILRARYGPHHPGALWISQLYPVTQAAIFIVLFAPRRYTERLIGLTLAAASVSLALRDAAGLDVLAHVIAWGTVVVLARTYTAGRLLTALGVYFGLGALCWMAYVAAPGWTTWLAYQATRALGIALWCSVAYRSVRTLAPRRRESHATR